jgi:hypothetical protein
MKSNSNQNQNQNKNKNTKSNTNTKTWKQIEDKYNKQQLNYINLDKLKFKVIRKQDDKFYKIVDNTKIRRNYSFNSEEIIKQSTLFDLGEMYLLSKIHISDSNLMKLKIQISPNIQGPWVSVENDITIVSGKIRIIKIGSLPCRYFRLTVIKGCPIMDFSKIECFGLDINDVKNKYDDDTLEMLYYNSYELIYRKTTSNFNSNYDSNSANENEDNNSANENDNEIDGTGRYSNNNNFENTGKTYNDKMSKGGNTMNNYSSYNSKKMNVGKYTQDEMDYRNNNNINNNFRGNYNNNIINNNNNDNRRALNLKDM